MPDIVGRIECNNCSAVTELKTNRNGKAYWNCTCGARQYYTLAATNELLKKLSGEQENANNQEQTDQDNTNQQAATASNEDARATTEPESSHYL